MWKQLLVAVTLLGHFRGRTRQSRPPHASSTASISASLPSDVLQGGRGAGGSEKQEKARAVERRSERLGSRERVDRGWTQR